MASYDNIQRCEIIHIIYHHDNGIIDYTCYITSYTHKLNIFIFCSRRTSPSLAQLDKLTRSRSTMHMLGLYKQTAQCTISRSICTQYASSWFVEHVEQIVRSIRIMTKITSHLFTLSTLPYRCVYTRVIYHCNRY